VLKALVLLQIIKFYNNKTLFKHYIEHIKKR